MRILHLADLHFKPKWFSWAASVADEYDAVVVAGDLLNMFDRAQPKLREQIVWTMDWLRRFPAPIFVCSGNHDYYPPVQGNEDLREGIWLRQCARDNLWCDGQTADFGGKRWSVLSWAWSGDDWADTADIVVVHAPPSHTRAGAQDGRDLGDPEVRRGIVEKSPWLVLSGHVHEPRHWHDRVGKAWCLNPGCDLTAELPDHIVIDTAAATATWISIQAGERSQVSLKNMEEY